MCVLSFGCGNYVEKWICKLGEMLREGLRLKVVLYIRIKDRWLLEEFLIFVRCFRFLCVFLERGVVFKVIRFD